MIVNSDIITKMMLIEMATLVLEGARKDLIKMYPELEAELSSLQPKYLNWLNLRFGKNPKAEEIHPIEDVIPTLSLYAQSEQSIKAKSKNKKFIDLVAQTIGREVNPADILNLTADEINTVIGLSQRKKQRFDVKDESVIKDEEHIGKAGPWNVWLPHTRESSCQIAGYDPVTRKEKTDWCTARTSGSNLFYNYIGSAGKRLLLFYVIKDNPEGDDDWLSVGYLDGERVLDGQRGGISVNRANVGLTDEKFENAIGNVEHEAKIFAMMDKVYKELDGRSPAYNKFKQAATDPDAYKSMLLGLSEREKSQVLKKLVKIGLSLEVFSLFEKEHEKSVLHMHLYKEIADNTRTSPEVLAYLANPNIGYVDDQKSWSGRLTSAEGYARKIREIIVLNPSTPQETLRVLSEDPKLFNNLVHNPTFRPTMLVPMAKSDNAKIRERVALYHESPAEALNILANDENVLVRRGVASNRNTPPEALALLTKDKDLEVLELLARNPNIPEESINFLAKNVENDSALSLLADHEKVSPEVLDIIARKQGRYSMRRVAKNPKTLPKTLDYIARDFNNNAYAVVDALRHPNAPRETLEFVGKNHPDPTVRGAVRFRLRTGITAAGLDESRRDTKMILTEEKLKSIILDELRKTVFKEGLRHHYVNRIPVHESIYRIGSPCYFNVISQARDFYKKGLYEVVNEEERDILENTSLGEWAMFEGEEIPLDFPMYTETLEEAKKKKKKDPPIGKPSRNTGSGKKYKVFVRNPKTGKIKKITYGDSKGGLKGGWNSPEARKSFAARHKCAEKKDRTKPGYWACRAHKDFGPGIGRFW